MFRILLLSADALLIGLHLCHRLSDWSHFSAPEFDITVNYGLAESFSYIKLLWIVLLLVWLGRRERRAALLAWAALFGYLLIDDVLKFREAPGESLVSLLNDDPNRYLVGGMRTQDLGEIAIVAAVALPVLAILVTNYVRGSQDSRHGDRKLALLLVLFACFAVGVDLLAELFTADAAHFVLTLIEDGGELVMLSLIAAYAFALHAKQVQRVTGR